MKRTIKRQFDITDSEIREAIYDWLKAQDVPVPPDPKGLSFDPEDGIASWTETADIEPRK